MSHAAPPLVSVCIPLYNGALYIREAIESVLAQTLEDWELVITDDCSTDGSSEIVAAYSDPRIRYVINKECLGAEGNWNRCVNEGRGKYRKLLCHDDRLAPNCLACQVEVLEKPENVGVAFVASARHIVMPDGSKIMTRRWKRNNQRIRRADAIRQIVRSGTNMIGEPGAVLFREEDWKELSGFNGEWPYVIDLEFWMHLLGRGDCFYLADALCDFRISQQSWSFRLAKQQGGQFCSLVLARRKVDPRALTCVDVACGYVRAHVLAFLRRLLYLCLVKQVCVRHKAPSARTPVRENES